MRVNAYLRAASVAAVAALSLTACGGGSGTTTKAAAGTKEHTDDISVGVKPDPAAVKLLPAAVKAKGTLTVPMDLTSPPTTFMASDNKTPIGFNPDVARLIAKKLGMKLAIKNVKFDTVIPGLQGGRYDFTASTMGTTADRLKVLDMIDYFKNGSGVSVKYGNPEKLTVNNLCGHSIAVQSGSTQEITYLPEMNKACTSKGKPAIKAVTLPSVNDAFTQLVSSRVDGVFYDSTSLTWAAKQQPNTFTVLKPLLRTAPVALALKKHSPLTPAIKAAMQSIIDSPKYEQALNRWGFQGLGIKKAAMSKPHED